jgi:RHS repeat-associated protein
MTPACAANPQVGSGTPRKFTGKERDAETGLDYFDARYYGSRLGRFATADPVTNAKAAFVNPQRWNRYAYVRNNPLRYVDRDGRDVSIAVSFSGSFSAKERSAILGKVQAWYGAQGVGNVYVCDAASAQHGAWFASLRMGYASIEVTSDVGDKERPDKVFAGNFAMLPDEERMDAISNAVVRETAAHHFRATYLQGIDQLACSREGLAAGDPQATARYHTVADSYAYATRAPDRRLLADPFQFIQTTDER